MAYPEDGKVLIRVLLFCPQDQRDLFDAAESPAGEPVDDGWFALDVSKAHVSARNRAFQREVRRGELGREPV